MQNNIPKATIDQFCNIVKEQFNEGNLRPMIGIGKGGIGKSESIASICKEMGIGYIDVRLLLYKESDLKGIPYPDDNHVYTVWLQNRILPIAERDGERGILVFDEVTSCVKSVRTAAYQLLQERCLGEYRLPDGWMVVCLGNGIDDGGDFNGIELNFMNRCSVYDIQSNFDVWKSWAMQNNVNPLVLGYLSWKVTDFHTFNPDEEYNIFASPRSWKAVSDIMNTPHADPNNTTTYLRVCGCVGTDVGNEFIAFCKLKVNAIEPEDILSGNYPTVVSSDKSVLMITVQSLIRKYLDETSVSVENSGELSTANIDRGANMITWLMSLKGTGMLEVKTMALRDLCRTNSKVLHKLMFDKTFDAKCPELGKFLIANRDVIRQNE